jgi:hypothetical protein
MGKLTSKDILQTRPPSLQIQPVAGWSWYCGYHDSFGIADDQREAYYMAGAHINYREVDDECEIHIKNHEQKKAS